MISKKYKAGDIVIKTVTPCETEIRKPYCDFLCDDSEKEDYTAEFEFVPCLPEVRGSRAYESDDVLCTLSEGRLNCFYKGGEKQGYYALRIPSENKCRVMLPGEYREKLWDRVIFTLIGAEEISALKDALIFHSSFVLAKGGAVLFTGQCGIGKSTQAALWEKYAGAEIINGDKSLIYMKAGRAFASGLPFSGSSPICKNISCPIKAIINLGQAKENRARRLSAAEGFSAVYRSTYPPLNIRELKNRQMNVIEQLFSAVPVYDFYCLPDESAVRYLEEVLK